MFATDFSEKASILRWRVWLWIVNNFDSAEKWICFSGNENKKSRSWETIILIRASRDNERWLEHIVRKAFRRHGSPVLVAWDSPTWLAVVAILSYPLRQNLRAKMISPYLFSLKRIILFIMRQVPKIYNPPVCPPFPFCSPTPPPPFPPIFYSWDFTLLTFQPKGTPTIWRLSSTTVRLRIVTINMEILFSCWQRCMDIMRCVFSVSSYFLVVEINRIFSRLQSITILKDAGAKLDATNKYGNTAIHLAALNGHKSTIEFLESSGLDLHAQNNAGSTPLHYAGLPSFLSILSSLMLAMMGRVEVMKYLIEKGGDINSINSTGSTPLHAGSLNGYGETMVAISLYLVTVSDCF